MPRTVPALLAALVPFLQPCGSESSSSRAVPEEAAQSAARSTAQASAVIDFRQVADGLLARLDLQSDERVLLVGLPGRFDPLIPLLFLGVARHGLRHGKTRKLAVVDSPGQRLVDDRRFPVPRAEPLRLVAHDICSSRRSA